ncbi:MAG: PEP-utilizing enzyme [Patescibacteria group bacterium]|jgi:phosphohistidine swiveling domain-containing protein
MKKIKEIYWEQLYTRRFSIHKLDVFLSHIGKELKKNFSADLTNILIIGQGLEAKWYFDKNQFKRFGEKVLRKTINDARKDGNHIRAMVNRAKDALKSILSFKQIDFKSLSPAELLRHYHHFLQAADSAIPIIYAPLTLDNQLFVYLKKILDGVYQKDQSEAVFHFITQPIKRIPIIQLEIDLLKFLNKNQRSKFSHNSLERLRKKYLWYGMSFVDSRPAKIEDFIKLLKKYKKSQSQGKLALYLKESQKVRVKFHKIVSAFSQPDRRFLRLINQYCYLMQYRDVCRSLVFYYGHFLYQEISRRFGIIINDLMFYTIDEMAKLIGTGKRQDKPEIQRRKRRFIYLMIDNRVKLISQPQKIKNIMTIINRQSDKPSINKHHKLFGHSAYLGRVQGKVRIIRINRLYQDLLRIKNGEILVAHSTKPDFVPAMKKAAAVITDEGGITCHAAVISRELKIPCVVGTKIATRVFITGDMVEVDADKGIVRKL